MSLIYNLKKMLKKKNDATNMEEEVVAEKVQVKKKFCPGCDDKNKKKCLYNLSFVYLFFF